MTSNAAHDRAREIFKLAVASLVGPKSLVQRLRNAATHLGTLQTREMPEHMQANFTKLKSDLVPIVEMTLASSARNNNKHALTILDMYTELLGGL